MTKGWKQLSNEKKASENNYDDDEEPEFFTVQNAIGELIRRKELGLEDRPDHDKLVNEIEEIYNDIVAHYIVEKGCPRGGNWPGSDIVDLWEHFKDLERSMTH